MIRMFIENVSKETFVLRDHLNKMEKEFNLNENEVLGIFLIGSQNYGISTEKSDVDSIILILPSFKSMATAATPISTCHTFENGEKCHLLDIRLFVKNFKKYSLNYLEVLFTKYYVINTLYLKEWRELVKERELLAKANPEKLYTCLKGMAYGYWVKGNIDNQKRLRNVLRIQFLLENFHQNSFEYCLTKSEANRHNSCLLLEDGFYTFDNLCEDAIGKLEKLDKQDFKTNKEDIEEMEMIFDYWLQLIIGKYLDNMDKEDEKEED